MAKKPRRMTLYEAVRNNKVTSSGRFKDSGWPKSPPDSYKVGQRVSDETVHKKGSGRIVLVVPYNILAVILLTIVLVAVIAFKRGQVSGQRMVAMGHIVEEVTESGDFSAEVSNDEVNIGGLADSRQVTVTGSVKRDDPISAGDHEIIIVQYDRPEHLVPVKDFFAYNGIETRIDKRDKSYFLVTSDRYESTERSGSEGYRALQRIKQIGVSYKAPQGYETFKPNLFQDAYGAKVK